jgi:Domain of unknown function (DUF1735).
MNNKSILFSAMALAALVSCNNLEDKLLETKVFFDEKELSIELPEEEFLNVDINSRLSSVPEEDGHITYSIGEESDVAAYNAKHGTEGIFIGEEFAKFSNTESLIKKGSVHTDKVQLKISNLDKMEGGKVYVLPLRIKTSTVPVMQGADVKYLIVKAPVKITSAWSLASNHISVPIPVAYQFTSVTYEALVYFNYFGGNNTIMGTEGTLILRVGDTGGGKARNWPQVAGEKDIYTTDGLETGRWYHMAFTFDGATGKAILYVNAEKKVEATWDSKGFALGSGVTFMIGKVAGFMWGERPFYGMMSEVRLWNVARSANDLKNNMLKADPASEGLYAYYKLDGTDQFQGEDGRWYIKDASGHENMNGLSNGGSSPLSFKSLDEPIAVK